LWTKVRGISQESYTKFRKAKPWSQNIVKKCYFFHFEAFYGYYEAILNQVPILTNQIMVGSGVRANSGASSGSGSGPLFSSSDLRIWVLPEPIPDPDPVLDQDPATDPGLGPLFFLIDLRIRVLIKMLWIRNTVEVYKNYQQNFISMPI
jgi:hypothetical protein